MANQQAQDDISEKVKKAFCEMDTDGSGSVSIVEFLQYCRAVPGMNKAFQSFAEADESRDQKITLEELDQFCRRIPVKDIEEQHVTNVFNSADVSGDGKLNYEEFRALLLGSGYPESRIQSAMDIVSEGDGMITLEEFLKEWHKDC